MCVGCIAEPGWGVSRLGDELLEMITKVSVFLGDHPISDLSLDGELNDGQSVSGVAGCALEESVSSREHCLTLRVGLNPV